MLKLFKSPPMGSPEQTTKYPKSPQTTSKSVSSTLILVSEILTLLSCQMRLPLKAPGRSAASVGQAIQPIEDTQPGMDFVLAELSR